MPHTKEDGIEGSRRLGHWGHNEAAISCLNSPPLYYLCDRKKFLVDEVKLPVHVALIVILADMPTADMYWIIQKLKIEMKKQICEMRYMFTFILFPTLLQIATNFPN